MEPVADVPLVDGILAHWRAALGRDHAGYRHHVYRVLNGVRALGAPLDDRMLVAAAFHDLGIWSAGTFDYLAPSIAEARAWLTEAGRERDAAAVQAMIAFHHRVRPYTGHFAALVEPFRRADWADVTLGVLPFGVPRPVLRTLRRRFPDAGFHRRLVALTGARLLRHPLDPLPMLRW